MEKIAVAMLKLAMHVFKDSNAVISPASIIVVLSVISAGFQGSVRNDIPSFLNASSPGELHSVATGILSGVFADGSVSGGPAISAANCVWHDQSFAFAPSFKDLLESFYGAPLKQVDFKTKADEVIVEVNSWVENKTKGFISDLLPPKSADSTTESIFVNAFYFNGRWDSEFEASLTKDGDFHLLNGTSVRVPFMTKYDSRDHVKAYEGFKVMELPYQDSNDEDDGRRFSMFIYLPDEKDGLPALVEKMGSSPGFLDDGMPQEYGGVRDFRIPRFKFSFGFKVSDALKDLGLKNIDPTFHKSYMEVDEGGTKAAAATATLRVGSCRGPDKEFDFVADHPFLFLVKENSSGAVLFIGQVLDPSQH